MKTITLTAVFRTNKNKDGSLLMGKNGKNYERLGIKCQEYGETWLSGFGAQWNQSWAEGDKVNVEIKEVKSGDKTYINFDKADETKMLEERIVALENAVFGKKEMTPVADNAPVSTPAAQQTILDTTPTPAQGDDIDVSDIPF